MPGKQLRDCLYSLAKKKEAKKEKGDRMRAGGQRKEGVIKIYGEITVDREGGCT